MSSLRALAELIRRPFYRRAATLLGTGYLLLYLLALQDLSRGGRGWEFLVVEWGRMFERTGPLAFEAVARLTVPGATLLLSPLNLLVGMALGVLAGLNLSVTLLALREPATCRFRPGAGLLAGIPALLAGGACCAPALLLVLGLQASSLLMATFQLLVPASLVLLLLTLHLALRRTHLAGPEARSPIRPSSPRRRG